MSSMEIITYTVRRKHLYSTQLHLYLYDYKHLKQVMISLRLTFRVMHSVVLRLGKYLIQKYFVHVNENKTANKELKSTLQYIDIHTLYLSQRNF